ncbi:MAG: hypothetical protein VB087_12625 [Candidatus Limiplasma sp.]|nr:hypothetical protein [Candidatus Limiplasma sp.]
MVKDTAWEIKMAQLTKVADALSDTDLHKVYVYARTLAQLAAEKQKEQAKPAT